MRFDITSFGLIASMYCSSPSFSNISSALRSDYCFDDYSCTSETLSFEYSIKRNSLYDVHILDVVLLPSFSEQILLSRFESIILCPPFDVMLLRCWSFESKATDPRLESGLSGTESEDEDSPWTERDALRIPFYVCVYFFRWIRPVIHSVRSCDVEARSLKFLVV